MELASIMYKQWQEPRQPCVGVGVGVGRVVSGHCWVFALLGRRQNSFPFLKSTSVPFAVKCHIEQVGQQLGLSFFRRNFHHFVVGCNWEEKMSTEFCRSDLICSGKNHLRGILLRIKTV